MSNLVRNPVALWAPRCLAGLFLGSGALHLVRPSAFRELTPGSQNVQGPLIFVSGLAELACGAGLLARAPWAGMTSAALLIAVFPGNVIYAIRTARRPGASRWHVRLAWARLPLQAPLIWAALQADGEDVRPSRAGSGADARI